MATQQELDKVYMSMAEIESWNWDGDCPEEIFIEDIKDDLYKVEKVQVTTYEWRKVCHKKLKDKLYNHLQKLC